MRKLLLIVGIFGMSATAFAGFKGAHPITVSASGRYASGSMGYVRSTADSVQYITCYTFAYNTYAGLNCSARDAAGTTVICSSTNPNLVTALTSMNGDSLLYFQWDASGQCTSVEAATGSYMQPKAP